MSFLVLQSSRWGRESWLLYFCCVLNGMSLLSFFGSSSLRSVVCDFGISWSYSLFLVYKFKRIVGKPNFSDQFKKDNKTL